MRGKGGARRSNAGVQKFGLASMPQAKNDKKRMRKGGRPPLVESSSAIMHGMQKGEKKKASRKNL